MLTTRQRKHLFLKWDVSSLAPLAFLLTWSSGGVAVKIGLTSSNALSFLALRSSCSLVFLLLAIAILNLFRNKKVRLRDGCTKNSFCVGLLLQVLYQATYFLSIDNGISLGMLAIILGLQPLLVPILARESLDLKRFALLSLALSGLICAVYGAVGTNGPSLRGLCYGAIALAAITSATTLQSRSNTPLLPGMVAQFSVASLVYLSAIPILGWHASPSLSLIIAVGWMSLVVSVGSTLLLFFLLSRELASRVTSLFFMVPVLAMGADHWIFHRPVSVWLILGGILVMAGMVMYRSITAPQG